MYGYIRVDKPECKIREYEYYRGVYCGLCRALGKCGGAPARFTLNYDFTFFALARMAVTGEKPVFSRRRCVAHPFARHIEAKPNDALACSAAASLLLAYEKNRDDIADEKGARRFRARLLAPVLRGFSRRPSREWRELEKTIAGHLRRLSEMEKNPPLSVDRPAEIFGNLMADILSFALDGEQGRIAAAIGMAVGKWVYLIDVLDDLEEDVKRGRYNPIATVFGDKPLDEAGKEELRVALLSCLGEAERAFDLIEYPDRDMKNVIENHLYLGMPGIIREILSKKENLSDERSL